MIKIKCAIVVVFFIVIISSPEFFSFNNSYNYTGTIAAVATARKSRDKSKILLHATTAISVNEPSVKYNVVSDGISVPSMPEAVHDSYTQATKVIITDTSTKKQDSVKEKLPEVKKEKPNTVKPDVVPTPVDGEKNKKIKPAALSLDKASVVASQNKKNTLVQNPAIVQPKLTVTPSKTDQAQPSKQPVQMIGSLPKAPNQKSEKLISQPLPSVSSSTPLSPEEQVDTPLATTTSPTTTQATPKQTAPKLKQTYGIPAVPGSNYQVVPVYSGQYNYGTCPTDNCPNMNYSGRVRYRY